MLRFCDDLIELPTKLKRRQVIIQNWQSAHRVSTLLSAIIVLATALNLSSARPVYAADKVQPLQWLRTQPLTLFDWGIWRLERDINRVGRWLEDAEDLEEPPLTGVEWSWRRQKLTIFVSIVRRPALRTPAYCQRLYSAIRGKLLGANGPTGPGRASWYLRNIFFPQGREWTRPTKNFAERLTKLVSLQLVMLGHPSEGLHLKAPKIACFALLNADKPTVKIQAVN